MSCSNEGQLENGTALCGFSDHREQSSEKALAFEGGQCWPCWRHTSGSHYSGVWSRRTVNQKYSRTRACSLVIGHLPNRWGLGFNLQYRMKRGEGCHHSFRPSTLKKANYSQVVVVHSSIPSTREEEACRSLSIRPAWSAVSSRTANIVTQRNPVLEKPNQPTKQTIPCISFPSSFLVSFSYPFLI